MPTSDPDTVTVSASVRGIKGSLIVVKVSGRSMWPLLRPKQKVVIKLTSDVQDGQVVLANNQDGELTLKTYRVIKGAKVLHSENPEYQDVSAEQWTVLGRAVHIEETDPDGIYA